LTGIFSVIIKNDPPTFPAANLPLLSLSFKIYETGSITLPVP